MLNSRKPEAISASSKIGYNAYQPNYKPESHSKLVNKLTFTSLFATSHPLIFVVRAKCNSCGQIYLIEMQMPIPNMTKIQLEQEAIFTLEKLTCMKQNQSTSNGFEQILKTALNKLV